MAAGAIAAAVPFMSAVTIEKTELTSTLMTAPRRALPLIPRLTCRTHQVHRARQRLLLLSPIYPLAQQHMFTGTTEMMGLMFRNTCVLHPVWLTQLLQRQPENCVLTVKITSR